MNIAHPISQEAEARWQHRNAIFLWVTILVVVLITAALLIGNAHGIFHSGTEGFSAPSWPGEF